MDEVAGRTISPRCGYRALVALLARPQPQMASVRTVCAGQKPWTTSRTGGSRSHTHFLGLKPRYHPENCNSATEDTENTERFKDLNHHIVRTRLVNQGKDPNP